MPADVIAFYSGTGGDHRGRRIAEIWEWPDEELERVHDYIQWLFPLREKSGFNVNAPVLEESSIGEFRKRPDLQQNLRRSFQRMLEFYGLEMSGTGVSLATRSESTRDRGMQRSDSLGVWVTYGNHNHLRITRILKSLSELGLEEEANAFFNCLEEIYRDEERKDVPGISGDTFRFWREAVRQPSR